MTHQLFLLGLDLIGTGVLIVVAYKLGQWGKQTEVDEAVGELSISNTCLRESLDREYQQSCENKLLWAVLQVPEETKACDTCQESKPLNHYHSHPTCKCCRKEEDAARYKAKKEVLV